MDYSDRVKAIRIEPRRFTDPDTKEVIDYQRLVFDVDFDGQADILEFKVDTKDAKLLKAADVQEV